MSTIQLEKQQVPDGGGGSAEDVEKALQAAQEAAESAQEASISAKNAEDKVDELSNELNENLAKIDEAYTKADNAEQLANGLDSKINSEKDERVADIANVKELITTEEEARKAGDKANSDAIGIIKTDVSNNALSIEQNTQGISAVNQTVSNLSSSTESFINSTNTKLDTTVQFDTSVTGNDSTVTISKVTGKLGGEPTSTEMALPVASEDKAGVINPATYKQIQDASEKIETILVGSVLVNNLPENPTDEQLTSAWKENTGKDTLINGAKVTSGDGKTYTYYSNTNSWKESAAGGGAIEINQFTNTSAGIIKGSTEDGKVFAESDGSGSVNGWDTMIARANSHDSEIEKLKQDMETEDTRTKNLPPQVMYKTSLTDYMADKVEAHLVVKDLHTGGDATIPVELTGATATRAGVMTAQQVADLNNTKSHVNQLTADLDAVSTRTDGVEGRVDTLETMAEEIESSKQDKLTAGENITISGNTISSTGGGKLYNEYSAATDGANTAAFIQKMLQGSNVILGNAASGDTIAIGEGAQSNGAQRLAIGTNADARGVYSHAIGNQSIAVGRESVAVGYNTETTGANALAIGSSSIAQETGVSVGYSAKSGIGCTTIGYQADNSDYTDSVALGSLAKNTRNNEFVAGAVPTIHANIKAGELDTDAVNLAQLNAVSETANDAKTMASAASSAATAAASAATTVDGRVDGVVTEVNTIKQDYMKTENYHIMTAEEFKAAWNAA